MRRSTEHNVRWNCAIYTYSSQGQSLSHYYWHAARDGNTLFTWSQWGNNSLCITTTRNAKSLPVLGSPINCGRSKNPHVVALDFLTQYKLDGNDLLEQIITVNESWIHFYQPKKNQWAWFGKKEKEAQRKFKNEWSIGKMMLMAFSDCCSLVYTEFGSDALKEQQNVTQDTYFNTLIRLRNVIWSKRRGFFSIKSHFDLWRCSSLWSAVNWDSADRFSLGTLWTSNVLTGINTEWLSSLSPA